MAEHPRPSQLAHPFPAVAAELDQHLLGVLSPERPPPGRALAAVQTEGGADGAHRAENRVLVLHHCPPGHRLRLLESLKDRVHPGAGDAGRGESLQPLLYRPLGKDGVEDGEQLLPVAVAAGKVGEALVGSELRPPQGPAQALPELLLGTGHHQPPVGGPEVLKRDDGRVGGVAAAGRDVAVGSRPSAHVHELVEGGLEQRHVAVAAHPVPAGPPQPSQESDGGGVPAGEIDEREARLGGRAVRLSGQAHPAGQALHHVVVAAFPCPRSRHPESGQGAADHTGVDVPELLVGEAQAPGLVAAQVQVDRVHPAHQVLHHRPGLGVAEIEGHRPLAPVEGLEEEGVLPFLEGGHVATHVAAGSGILDLDDLRPQVGQLEGRPGTGPELLHRQHPHVLQGQPHRTSSTTSAASRSAWSRKSPGPAHRLRMTWPAPALA